MPDPPPNGNQIDAAFVREAVAEYEQPLMRYAVRQLRDADLAREVVQDTFLKLWQTDRSKVDGHLAAWLFTVCRNRSFDVRKKERRMTTLGEHTTHLSEPDSAAARPTDQPTNMTALMETLPEQQQEVLRLRFGSDLSYREIAQVLDLTVSHVGVLIHKAVQSIRTQLPGAIPDDGANADSVQPNPRIAR